MTLDVEEQHATDAGTLQEARRETASDEPASAGNYDIHDRRILPRACGLCIMLDSKATALDAVTAYFDDGKFLTDLARRVAVPTESQGEPRKEALKEYLERELRSELERMGFGCAILENSVPSGGPFLIAERIEDPSLPTVLTYGHGDVVLGMEGRWHDGLSPWALTVRGDRFYGRGSADNKGQHSINIAALAAMLQTRSKLGFNCKIIVETGEETGSPGLRDICVRERERLRADVFIASDGPRVSAEQPTVFLGSRGAFNFDVSVELREGSHHSGNWGGALENPAVILAHALATIADARGKILVEEWRPKELPARVRQLLRDVEISGGADSPALDATWGEPGLTPAENIVGWNTFEILSLGAGNPERPVNAIPGKATAHCQIRFVVGSDPEQFLPALRRHLDVRGFEIVKLRRAEKGYFPATRLDPDNPWVRWAVASIEATTKKRVALLPNLGGSIPNDIFAKDLGLPTIWIPHSYPACSQHAPNEHLLGSVAREALRMMTALFCDLADSPPTARS
jgi:acetylornithine deacetylase/succinyl-diaminopimelate desuccinylase-like protein